MLGLVKHFYLVILGWIMFELSTAQQYIIVNVQAYFYA